MQRFRYRGKNLRGDEIRGYYDAMERSSVAAMIKQQGYYPVYIEPDMPLFSSDPKVDPGELSVLFKELGILVKAGLNIIEILSLVELQTKNHRLKKTLQEAKGDLKKGIPLSASFGKHRGVVPDFAIKLIEIGESTGTLQEVLTNLSSIFKNLKRNQERFKSAMLYPIILVIVSSCVFWFLVSQVLPTYCHLFEDAKIPLPLPTRILLKFGENMGLISLLFFFSGISLYIGMKKLSSSSRGALKMAGFELNFPVWGSVVMKREISIFCTMLALSLSSGAPLLEAIEITKGVLNNKVLKNEAEKMRKGIIQGSTLAEVIDDRWFSHRLKQMIRSGEESGNLVEMLNSAATILEDELKVLQDRVLRMLEPSIVLVMSALVGFIVISVTLPMFSIYSFY